MSVPRIIGVVGFGLLLVLTLLPLFVKSGSKGFTFGGW
jgi:hypothetical protein